MDQDLERLKQQIEAKRAAEGGLQNNPPPVVVEQVPVPVQVEQTSTLVSPFQQVEEKEDLSEVDVAVDKLVAQAVVHKVSSDPGVKNEILNTAGRVVTNKIKAVEDRAEKESKEAYFDANKDACTIFGYDEKTTSKSHVKMMKAWAYLLNTLYICTFGCFVVAPIIFICKKLKVLIKQIWLAALVAILIYAAIIVTPVLIAKLSSCSSPDKTDPVETSLVLQENINQTIIGEE